ncbi:MAG: LLM class F420-dependent oxidoreductase [Acidimicrobiales bacterium]|jgi:F420-dependent oxidoreductase-like protein|nr:LLM class F420-dependent oxidoreductase [Acidimicrobiaceae bacterium]HIE67630.1 LLM class F420-dependent oxidoreductase [Acidimicrobiia bacterium]|tara:strand:+ start:6008 stop:7045 length:1038 start_codon:yes stop_codon:yes gene_type:complete
MRITTSLNYATDPQTAATQARELEAAGVDCIWVPEAYGFDAVSLLGYLAASTSTVELASGILNTYSRTPALLAQTAAGLDALSGGRFTLGLGASGPQVIEGFHGVPYDRPLTRMKEIIQICRSAWRRERLEHEGRVFTLPLPADQGTGLGKPLKIINHLKRSNIPIYIAALGQKSVEETAATCEGWLPFLVYPERMDQVWGDAVRAGKARRDDSLDGFDVVAGGLVAIGDDAAQYRDYARPMAALYIGGMGARGKNFYNDVCRDYGFADEAIAVQDAYLDGRKEEAAGLLPDELIQNTTLCGDEAYVVDRLAAYSEAGVTSLNVTPVGGEPAAVLGRLRELAEHV